MPILTTNWRDRVSDLDALVDGEPKPVPWLAGSDAPVPLDLTNLLADGEVVTNPVVTLRRLPAFGESDYAAAQDSILGSPVIVGNVILQQLQNLTRGGVYRMEVVFGAIGARRGASILVECVE